MSKKNAIDWSVIDGSPEGAEHANEIVEVSMTRFQLVLIYNMIAKHAIKLEKKGRQVESRLLVLLAESISDDFNL